MTLTGCAQRRPGREPRRHPSRADLDRAARFNRSTKAGARTPATRPARRPRPACRRPLNEGRGANPGDTRDDEEAVGDGGLRSTKAGARTPATLPTSVDLRFASSAQRRPGREPRRHRVRARISVAGAAAQRRPGREPRRHADPRLQADLGDVRSTKAGARTPATRRRPTMRSSGRRPLNEGRGANPGDTHQHPCPMRRTSSLNEGRGANPGDTSATPIIRASVMNAQRRPGREPRRHAHDSRNDAPGASAQRRPGREPRRHTTATAGGPTDAAALNEGRGANPGDTERQPAVDGHQATRSTKAGARTPATPGTVRGSGHPLADRSTKAGARTPATHARPAPRGRRRLSLNEGRGANPGDTASGRPPFGVRAALNEGRGANPGDTDLLGPALDGLLTRSTKAGARTPATPPRPWSRASPGASLNEGRGANPGDTPTPVTRALTDRVAQRRPGREPRRHERYADAVRVALVRSTKAGARTPATLGHVHPLPPPLARSTKAGARTPATPTSDRETRASNSGAQRRPGREPRRHSVTPSAIRPAPAAQRRPGREPRRHRIRAL